MALLSGVWSYLSENPGILIAGFLVYVFIFVLSLAFSGPKPAINPFKRSRSRPPADLVTDEKERDKVLKQGFLAKKVPEKLDCIVIGSGMGGLAVANILARNNQRVLVLEQHDQAGGCCHTFTEKGFEFDVGIHYIGEMRNNTVSRLLVDELTEGQLVWDHLDEEQDVVAIGEPGKARKYSILSNKEGWKKYLEEQFPDEKKAIDQYFHLLREVRMNMLGIFALKTQSRWFCKLLVKTGVIHLITKYFKYSSKSLKDTLDELTDNKNLKAVMSYSFGDYGTLPRDTSFSMQACLTNHFMYGSSYPRGGASEFAFHMIPVIERAGGRVLVRAPVSQILTNQKGHAIGVRVHKSSGDIDVHAPLIVSTAGIYNTFQTLLPKHIASKSALYSMLGKKIKPGIACMSLFVGLRGTTEELGLKRTNVWAFTGNDIQEISEEYLAKSAEEAMESEVPLLFVSFPSAKDSSYNDRHPGKSVCTVVTLAKWEWFEQWKDERVMKRGAEYENIKKKISDHMWEQVCALFPQLEDKVEYMDIGSPLSQQHYVAQPRGETYGLDHNKTRYSNLDVVMNLRPDTEIPGLMLSGQDVFSCGFAGALIGGLICSATILNRNLYDDVVQLKKSLKKST